MLREALLWKPYSDTKLLLKRSEFLPSEALRVIQKNFLQQVLEHATKNVPYYRSIVPRSPKRSNDPLERIENFPIIDKNVVRQHLTQFVHGAKYRRLKVTTGGSTGDPFAFFIDRFKTRQIEKAFIFDQWARVGFKFGDSIFNLRGRTPKKSKFLHHDRIFNIYYASSFNLKRNTVRHYINAINKIKPRFLHGYPSTMYQLAALMNLKDLKLDFVPKAVFCGSEKLFPFQRELIERIFQSRVFSWYGHSECLILGGECEDSHLLHVYPQYGYLELHPTGAKSPSGQEIYEIIATGFNNLVMPLIRFRTGDYATVAEKQTCDCCRNFLLLDEVIGREQEFVVDYQGDIISATSLIFGQHYPAFANLAGLFIEQRKLGEIVIYLKKFGSLKDEDFSMMKTKIQALLGDRFSVIYHFVDSLPRSPLGKAKLVKQGLDINRLLDKSRIFAI